MSLWALLLWAALHGPTHGVAMRYETGIFAHVAAVRGMPLAWGRVDGFAAVPNCAYVQPHHPWMVTARIGTGPIERYQVVDCQQSADRKRLARIGLILEVDHYTAERLADAGDPRLLLDGKAPVLVLGYVRVPGVPHQEERK